jgi:hypothetical protein
LPSVRVQKLVQPSSAWPVFQERAHECETRETLGPVRVAQKWSEILIA